MESRRIRGICRNCGEITKLADTVRIGNEIFGLCVVCTASKPDFVRAASSTARVLGFDVDDVRHRLRD
jgi:hypothetical protein